MRSQRNCLGGVFDDISEIMFSSFSIKYNLWVVIRKNERDFMFAILHSQSILKEGLL